MTFEHLDARMAGGMCQPVDDEELRRAVPLVLPATELGELDAIKELPGMVSASVDTLRKAWRADISLDERAGAHPRVRAVAQLEAAVLEALPSSMQRPGDLAAAALERLEHAPAILGPIDIVGLSGGQQQRVAVVRAVAASPALVLADEPTASLDSAASDGLLDVTEAINRDLGVTFLLATHDERVMERSRRLLRMVDGRIESDELRA